MAVLSNNAAVAASQGLGRDTFLYAVTIATVTVESATEQMTATYGLTLDAIDSTSNATCYVLASGTGGAEAISGVALTTTFAN